MFKVFTSILLSFALVGCASAQINLTSQVKGILAPTNGGFGIDTSASTGCPVDTNGNWTISPGNCDTSGGGTGFVYRGAFAPNTAYAVGDIVTNAGSTYETSTAFTSASTFNASNWNLWAAAGAQGQTGQTGQTGAAGNTGSTGLTGAAATIAVGAVNTGAAGSSATIVNAGTGSAAIFNFTIPKGDTGLTGATGTTGTTGATGSAGTAATVTVGTVQTGAAGTSATVVNGGTANAAVLNFVIPQGAPGSGGSGTSVTTTLGDLIYGGVSGVATRLAGNTSTVKLWLCQTGTGTISAAPGWCPLGYADVQAALALDTADSTFIAWSAGTNGDSSLPVLTPGSGKYAVMLKGGLLQYSPNGATPLPVLWTAVPFTALTDSATVTWAVGSQSADNKILNMAHGTATRVLNVTGLVNGGNYVVVFNQDSTGGATATLGSGCTWLQGGANGFTALTTLATMTTTPLGSNMLAFTYDGTNCRANFK
jgi:hypothetical protein